MLFFKLTLFEHIRDGTQKKNCFSYIFVKSWNYVIICSILFWKNKAKKFFFSKKLLKHHKFSGTENILFSKSWNYLIICLISFWKNYCLFLKNKARKKYFHFEHLQKSFFQKALKAYHTFLELGTFFLDFWIMFVKFFAKNVYWNFCSKKVMEFFEFNLNFIPLFILRKFLKKSSVF